LFKSRTHTYVCMYVYAIHIHKLYMYVYVLPRQRMRIPQRVAHVSFYSYVLVVALVVFVVVVCCLPAACANVNPLGLARAVADSHEKYMAMGFLCFVLFSYKHTYTDIHTLTQRYTDTKSERAGAQKNERQSTKTKKSKAKVRFVWFFFCSCSCSLLLLLLYTLGKFYARFAQSACV